ncbi:hypothetical protein SAMN05444162_1531 [Paenibacillaceae bacterium GAS479]|nr:hypothetical protein SAMN05444162_1531 [Paenibacillaceae bacterium GAS479]
MSHKRFENKPASPVSIILILFILLMIAIGCFTPGSSGPGDGGVGIRLTQGFDVVNNSSIRLGISLVTDTDRLDYPRNLSLAPGGTHHFELQVIPLETTSASVVYFTPRATYLSFTLENRSEFFNWYNPYITNISTRGPIKAREISGRVKLEVINA